MTHKIKLKDGASEPIAMDAGELAIYEEERLLYARTAAGIVSMPLDRVGLTLPDPNASSQVYVYRNSGIADRVTLDAGAGGVPVDVEPFRIPGLTPSQIVIAPYNNIHDTYFTVGEPIIVKRFRVNCLSGYYTSWGVEVFNERNELVRQNTLLGGPTAVLTGALINLPLDPGNYRLRLSIGAPCMVEAVRGYLPWRNEVVQHCIMMEIV